jgi:ribosomal protein S11
MSTTLSRSAGGMRVATTKSRDRTSAYRATEPAAATATDEMKRGLTTFAAFVTGFNTIALVRRERVPGGGAG